ncbi:MAG TPA: helicase-related protein, partial [Pseudomonadales bacterium]|nr:helicase-related protein [Pseudomonadales bacterium]
IVNVVTMKELVDTGFLVPFRVFAATEPNMEGVKVVAGEWQREETEKRGLQIIGDVIADYQKIVNSVFSGNPQKTIVFSSGVGHGAELVKRFASIGLNFVQISYLDSEEYKTDVLKEFSKKSSSIDGVISTDILTRGFDQPDVAHVVVAKPLRKSFSQHVQMIGRGARPYAGKEFCVIQDNSGNWLRFADSFDELYHDGVKTLDSDADKRTRKEKTEKEKKEARCPQCMQVWTGKVQVCPTCGFMREKKNKKEEVAGVLTELEFGNKTKKEQTQHKEWWYKQLLQYSRGKGYQDGWAYYAFNDKFGHFPHGYKKDTAPVGLECYNWITARNIRNSKRRKQA